MPANHRIPSRLKALLFKLQCIAEQASREVVLRRNLPDSAGGGPIYVSPGALLSFWHPDLRKADPQIFLWASDYVRPGDTVWDIGANVGLFSFAAANKAGPSGSVLAIEPDVWLVQLLHRSARVRSTGDAAVEVLPIAVSDKLGIARFSIAARSRAANHLADLAGSTQTGGVRETQSVPLVTIDWLLTVRPAPQVIKIDVEGAEQQVLAGARHMLQHIRPIIICEVRQPNATAVSELLHQYNYRLYDLQSQSKAMIRYAAFNTLAQPL